MTLRSYMRVLSTAIALLFVAVGCKDSDEEIPPPSEKYTFDIAVSDIRVADAVVTVTPSDALATYYCSVVKKADFDKLGSDEAYLDDDIDYLKAQAEKKQLTFKAYLETVIATGSEPIKFVTLEPSTDYYAYVYGITPEGRVTSDLKKTPFTTATPEPTELTFEFKVENITMTAADIAVIPSDDEAPYYFDVIAAAAYEGMSEDEILADVLDAIIPAYLTQGPDGYPAEMFEGMLALKPGTEYYVYAIGYDAEKEEPTSELQMYKFSTTAPTGEAPDLTFSARAGDADGNNTSTMIYCTAVSEAAVSAKMACLPKQIVDDFIGQGASLENIADANGQDVKSEDIAALNAKGGLGLTLAGDVIVPSTDYTVIFKVVSAGGRSTVKSENVSTTSGDVPPSDLTFSIAVTELKATSAMVTVTPSNDTETYFFDIQPKKLIDENFADDASLIAALDETYAKYGGIAGMLSQGEDGYKPTSLTAGTSYYVLAFGYNTAATTAVTRHEFTTETAATSDLTLSIAIDTSAEPIPGGVTAAITASNDEDPYMLDFMLADEIKGMSDAEIIASVEQKYGQIISWLLVTGDYATVPTDFGGELAMMPGAEYYLVAFGYDGASATTGVTKAKFTAGAGPDAAGTGFTFKVEDITSGGATVTVETTKEPVTYIWDVISDASYTQLGGNAEALVSHVTDMFALYGTAQYGNLTPVQVIAGLGAWYSGASYAYGKLSSKTAYRPYAACVDLSGNVVGTPAVGEIFTTLEAVAGSATVEAAYDKYFDGDEIVAAGVSSNASGKAYIPVTVTSSADAAHWYVALYTGDYTDPGAVSEATIINALKSQGVKDAAKINFTCSWDTQCTFLAVAEDATGNVGEIFRLGVRFTKSGASPISELTGASKAAAAGVKLPVLCSSLLPGLDVPKVLRPLEEPNMPQAAASQLINLRRERTTDLSEKMVRGAEMSGDADAISGGKPAQIKCFVGKNAGMKQAEEVSLKKAIAARALNNRVRTPRR